MPKTTKEKTSQLQLRLTQEERNKINELAKANNKKVSQFVLSQIFKGNSK